MKVEFCTSVPMFFGHEISSTNNTLRQQKIARLENEALPEGAYLREIAVGRIATRKNKYFVVKSENGNVQELIRYKLSSVHKIESIVSKIEYESRDNGVFLYNIFTKVELHGCDAKTLDSIIDRYQEVFPGFFSEGKIPAGIPMLDQSALDKIAHFAGFSLGNAQVSKISLCGSYAEFFAIFPEGQSADCLVDAGKHYKVKDDQQFIDIEYASGKNSRVISGYSIFGLITDDPDDAYKIFKEMVFHVNYHWNLIRDLRDGVQQRFLSLIAVEAKASDLAKTIKEIDRQSDLIRALTYEADSISVCEWAEERNLYQSLWNGWKGDELVGATSGYIEDVKSSVSRRYDERTSEYEGIIQILLTFITLLTIVSIVFQTVDFVYSSSEPMSQMWPQNIVRLYWLIFTAIFFAVVFMASLVVRSRQK
ncbi:hypothetical protein [Mesorhizobium sp. CO1-1-8]|uniref:hypothetical protein n=1 Tax=Mesorhizobium sp. CO1-1-8 TaxID=2876631 RepID=UPI001CD13EBE|nr:hypothetical protein [Mesorhizobium sp. CO1-1-8]MBZ9776502.1 hypothetical protein [Mesorhizobium sp. CO1-1-8]